jgi:hypothetical protein
MMKNIFKVDLTSLYVTFANLNKLLHSFTQNSKIFTVIDNEQIVNDLELGKYKSYLYLVAEEIYEIAKNKNIFIEYDDITDFFFINTDNIKILSSLELCKKCPCIQCKPDIELFQKHSINMFVPIENFCKKSFIEKEVSLYLYNKLSELNDMSSFNKPLDINYLEFVKFISLFGEKEEEKIETD